MMKLVTYDAIKDIKIIGMPTDYSDTLLNFVKEYRHKVDVLNYINRVACRFLDEKGGCSMHPDRPGVCYLYPFSTWLENEKGTARVHATYQFTGECPGFYLSDDLQLMTQELKDYSKIIYDYNMSSSRTMRENLGSVSFG